MIPVTSLGCRLGYKVYSFIMMMMMMMAKRMTKTNEKTNAEENFEILGWNELNEDNQEEEGEDDDVLYSAK